MAFATVVIEVLFTDTWDGVTDKTHEVVKYEAFASMNKVIEFLPVTFMPFYQQPSRLPLRGRDRFPWRV